MTKGQKNLIGLLFSVLLFAIIVFRSDLLNFPYRPRIQAFTHDIVLVWGISFAILLFGYFLAKTLKVKWWIFILLFLIWETSYVVIFNFGKNFLPETLKSSKIFGHFKNVSLSNRPLIQFDKNCARYDSTLFYTLKPGEFNFDGYEFSNLYKVNSFGFRDEEIDAQNPEVLFLGDSYTMGWGIDQDKTFSQLFQKTTNLKCLNTGISSYGTARELFNFKKINPDSLKLIVIQFHDTDLEENNYYIKNKKLGNKTVQDFKSQLENNDRIKKYYLFKHIKAAILDFISPSSDLNANSKKSNLGSAFQKYPNFNSDFFSIISEIRLKYKGPIFFTYVGSFYTEPKVVDEFENYAIKNNIIGFNFINMGGKLKPNDYFFLDDHINQNGHQKVANELITKWNIFTN